MKQRFSFFASSIARVYHRFSSIIDWIARAIAVTTLFAIVAIISAEVIYRYVLSKPLVWTEQLAAYLMIWLGFTAASIAMRQKRHIGMTLLYEKLPLRFRPLAFLISDAAIVFFLFVLTRWGVVHALAVRNQFSPVVFGMSMTWFYSSVPVGGFFMLVQHIDVILRRKLVQTVSNDGTAVENIKED